MAGESARAQHERIRERRLRRIRGRRDYLLAVAAGSVLLGAIAMQILIGMWWMGALVGLAPIVSALGPTQRELAWRSGAEGEEKTGLALDVLGMGVGARVLHDRRIPGSKANVDHVLIGPTGVWTVDAKNHKGKLETRRRGKELWVNGRNQSKLLDQARGQAEVVRRLLASAGLGSVPVHCALCFVRAQWPLFFRPESADDVELVSPNRVARLTAGPRVLSTEQIQRVSDVLDRSLSPAITSAASRPTTGVAMNRPTDSPSQPRPPESAEKGGVVVKEWKRYGKHRLYVNTQDGTTIGYVDLLSNQVVPVEERHRAVIQAAVACHLRES